MSRVLVALQLVTVSHLFHKFSQRITYPWLQILVTPLSRRGYSGGKIVENLANQTRLAIEAATSTTSRYIDLNRASTDYLNAIGETAAHTYDLKSGDSTHLNVWGSVVFGRMVSDLLLAKYSSDFSSYTLANATLSALIKEGKPA